MFQDDEMVSLGKCIQCQLCEKYCPDFTIEVPPRKEDKK
jgi:Pyruvate/2-oxoacid:ferredoxin oxidoreductase delta subunit